MKFFKCKRSKGYPGQWEVVGESPRTLQVPLERAPLRERTEMVRSFPGDADAGAHTDLEAGGPHTPPPGSNGPAAPEGITAKLRPCVLPLQGWQNP